MLAPPLLTAALAGPPEPTIEWSAPPGCPDEVQMLSQAARIMGRSAADVPLSEVSIRGRILGQPVGFAVEIEIATATGSTHKRASANDCTVLGNVAALMVAIAVDPVRAGETSSLEPRAPAALAAPPQPDPALEPATVPRVAPPASSARAPASTLRPSAWIQGLLRASGGLGRGLVPQLDGHVSLGAGLRTARLRAELVAFHVLAREVRYAALPTVGAEVAAWGGSLRAGPAFDLGVIELSAMAGISAAALTARGFGVLDPGREAAAWIALCFVPTLRWRPAPRWALGADIEAEAVLRRPAFALDTLPEVHRAAPIGVRGAIVVEVRLGLTKSLRAGD